MDRSVAVIGGGLAGLSAGHALQRAGVRVTLFESESRVGGRASTDEIDGYRIDAGAQLVASMYRRFLALARDIGCGESIVRVSGRDALWRDGRAHEVIYGSVASMATSGGLPFRTKLRLGTTYAPFLSKHSAALDTQLPERVAEAGLDRESIADWGEREMDRAFVDSLVYPQLGAYYGTLPEETSAGFYHMLARQGMDVTLFAIEGGIGKVAERLATRLVEGGADVRIGGEVAELDVGADGVEVRVEGGAQLRFDAVVSAVPAPTLLRIASGLPTALSEWLSAVRYRPSLSLALLLDQPVGARFFGLSFPRGDTRYTAAVAVQENKGVALAPDGAGLLVVLPTPEAAPTLIDLSSREILDLMLPEMDRAFPGIQSRVVRARVYRWPVGAPIFFPGYLQHLGEFRSSPFEEDLPLALAGDYLYAPTVEGAVASGLAAADRLGKKLSPQGTLS